MQAKLAMQKVRGVPRAPCGCNDPRGLEGRFICRNEAETGRATAANSAGGETAPAVVTVRLNTGLPTAECRIRNNLSIFRYEWIFGETLGFFEGFGGFETALRVGISAAMPMNTVIPFSLIVPREGGLKFIEIEGRRAQAYEGNGSASTRVKTLNSLTDQALALADSTEKHLFELQSSKLLFAQITQDLNAFSKDIEVSAEAFANLNNRISGLPKATQTMIWKNSNFKKLKGIFGPESDIDSLLQENLPDLESISTFTQLKNAPKLISKARDSRADIFNSSLLIKSIEKLIPKFVCVKGKIISVTPATGKCAPGATKTSTA